MPAPEIGIDDAGVACDPIRRALRDHFAVVQDHEAVGQLHQCRHDMLDHEHGQAVAPAQIGNQRAASRASVAFKPAMTSSSKSNRGAGGEGARNLEPLLTGKSQGGGGGFGPALETDLRQDRAGAGARVVRGRRRGERRTGRRS